MIVCVNVSKVVKTSIFGNWADGRGANSRRCQLYYRVSVDLSLLLYLGNAVLMTLHFILVLQIT